MRMQRLMTVFLAALTVATAHAADLATYSWRYYRPGNTGIQGDINAAIWIDADDDPWIAGYNPLAEEGGVAKFIQAKNEWRNVSNIDYPVMGSANEVGTSRVSDMVADDQGYLWLGTWRGVLRMKLAEGPSTLVNYGPGNSALPGGITADITRAPDGSIWISASSSFWGGGGLTRYDFASGAWSHIDGHGGDRIAAQPKPGGGYYIWAFIGGFSGVERWDSTTQVWTTFPFSAGQPAALMSLDSADAAGNVWMMRWIGDQGEQTLDCLRPDGTWVNPPLPPVHPQVPVAALRAFGNLQALMVDGYGQLYRFNGSAWTNLGPVPHDGIIDDLDIDSAGTVWLCGSGMGGVIRRDAATGHWQRYRVTNTSQFDFFNNALAVDPFTGEVYACANASSGLGGMVQFDGKRWTGFVNDLGYGLTGPWPWSGAPQSEAIFVRPSNGHVVVNPINNFTHEFDGTTWTAIPGGPDQIEQYAEDSLGRLWGMGHYGGMGIYQNGGFTLVDTGGWSGKLRRDPVRAGTVWANEGWKLLRTDGTYAFSRAIEDFPELTPNFSNFEGLAVSADGQAWVGATTLTGGALLKVDAETGTSQVLRSDLGWPFPADHVYPLTVTPDGRLWLAFSRDYPSTDAGLLWWDGSEVGVFLAPPNGAWDWGGLPHAGIKDLQVKPVTGGYELWMSCLSRGIATLTVHLPAPAAVGPTPARGTIALHANFPNPFNPSTGIRFTLPETAAARLRVFDLAGRLVKVLYDDAAAAAGDHEVVWDGRDTSGQNVASGVYFYRLESGGFSRTKTMVLTK
jgi:streptogramin lyase